MSSFTSGRLGEETAIAYLQKLKYKILTKNFHSRFGEIDIIALDQNTLVFIEVKTRWSKKFGSPQEAVTPWKLKSIIKTAEYFKVQHPKTPELMRIDVVAIQVEGQKITNIELMKNVSM